MSDTEERRRLHQEIEQTRAELGETVAALAKKADVKANAGRKLGEAKEKAATQARMLKDKATEQAGELKEKAGPVAEQLLARAQTAREQVAGRADEVKERVSSRVGSAARGDAGDDDPGPAVRTRSGAGALSSRLPEGVRGPVEALIAKARANPPAAAGVAAALTALAFVRKRRGKRRR